MAEIGENGKICNNNRRSDWINLEYGSKEKDSEIRLDHV